MHKIGKLGLQVFAAPENMTGQAQIQVKARADRQQSGE